MGRQGVAMAWIALRGARNQRTQSADWPHCIYNRRHKVLMGGLNYYEARHPSATTDILANGGLPDGPVMNDTFRLLLEKAARLHDRHEAGRREPFNVFSVLRSEHDEVNLHSRFLAALLDHRRSPGQSRKNLADFVRRLDISGFDHDGATVDREWNNIDILVRDQETMQAVIIENKIWAADQPRQLARYAEQMQEYDPLHVLYLTPDGRESSEDSADGVEYRCISYKGDLVPWLKGCQKRAYDEPDLRESVAQYVRLIAKLTGTDFSEAYMNDLKKLCLQDDNLLLVHDLGQAMVEAKISLLEKLWQEIEAGLHAEQPDLPVNSEDSDISEARIRRFVTYGKNYKWHGLYFALDETANIGVEVDNYIFFGVSCGEGPSKEKYSKYAANLKGWHSTDQWPLFRYPPTDLNLKHTPREQLALLAAEQSRQDYVAEVVSGVSALWTGIKESGLVHRCRAQESHPRC